MELITSLHNPRVKAAGKLRDRRVRQAQGRLLIDGTREIARAVQAGLTIVEAFACPQLCTAIECRELLVELEQRRTPVVYVSEAVFGKLAYGERHDGLVAVAEMPRTTIADLRLTPECVVAVLEGLEKPGNIGAALRSADATGVAAVIVADRQADIYNPNCIRASLGTVFTLPVCNASSQQALAWLREQKFTLYAARVDGPQDYRQVRFARRAAIVLGSEAEGLSGTWSEPDVQPIKLPMLGVADSLNVSVTAAVLFYEALRQRDAADC